MLYITSLHAESPRNLPHYSASKGGETMIMKELARARAALHPRQRDRAGCDSRRGFKADVSALIPAIAMRRMGAPEDMANMAVALVSERFSAYVTGTTVAVDGGLALYNWIPTAAQNCVGYPVVGQTALSFAQAVSSNRYSVGTNNVPTLTGCYELQRQRPLIPDSTARHPDYDFISFTPLACDPIAAGVSKVYALRSNIHAASGDAVK